MTFATLRAVVLLATLGMALAGCDKCGDWPWAPRAEAQACKGTVPR